MKQQMETRKNRALEHLRSALEVFKIGKDNRTLLGDQSTQHEYKDDQDFAAPTGYVPGQSIYQNAPISLQANQGHPYQNSPQSFSQQIGTQQGIPPYVNQTSQQRFSYPVQQDVDPRQFGYYPPYQNDPSSTSYGEQQPRRPRSQANARQIAERGKGPEKVIPFPGGNPSENIAQPEINVYAINVFNTQACRQAMGLLRNGQIILIVMDQLQDRNQARRLLDMLTGACFALDGSITRLSNKIGFYVMAPANLTVYTDPFITKVNNPNVAMQRPQPRSPQTDFTQQTVPEMNTPHFEAQQMRQTPYQSYPYSSPAQEMRPEEGRQTSSYPSFEDQDRQYEATSQYQYQAQ